MAGRAPLGPVGSGTDGECVPGCTDARDAPPRWSGYGRRHHSTRNENAIDTRTPRRIQGGLPPALASSSERHERLPRMSVVPFPRKPRPSGPARPRALNHDVLPGGGQGECGVLALLLRDKRVGRNRTHRRAGGVSMPAGMIPCRHANSCSGQGSCGRHSSWRHSRSAPRRSPPPPRPRPGRRLRSGSRNASGKAVFNTEDGRAPAVTCRSGRLSGGYSQASMAWSSASRSMYGSPLSRPTVSPSPARVKGPGWVSMRPSPTSRSPW